MKKLKKIYDFEVVSFLTIIILIVIAYLPILLELLRGAGIENDLFSYCIEKKFSILNYNIVLKNITSEIPVTVGVEIINLENNIKYSLFGLNFICMLVSGILFIINFIAGIIYMVINFFKYIYLKKFYKIFKDEIIDKTNIELPLYNIAIINTLYTGKLDFSKMTNFFKNYFIEKGILNKKNEFIYDSSEFNKLDKIEKSLISIYKEGVEMRDEYQKKSDEISIFLWLLNDIKIRMKIKQKYKEMIDENLEENLLLKRNTFKEILDKIDEKIVGILNKICSLDKYDIKSRLIYVLIPWIILMFVYYLNYYLILIGLVIIYLKQKYYKIFSTKEGKKERIKINLILKNLKNKLELTEEEKYFYYALYYKWE